MQEKYAGTGKFTVVLSYVQELDQEAREFLAKEHGDIPIYDQLRPQGAECGPGIPDAYLFDHTGKIVKHAHPASLYGLVEELIEAVPDPVPPGILGAFEPEILFDECDALRDPAQPVRSTLQRLERYVEEDALEAEEARAILALVSAWVPEELARIERRRARHPARAAWDAECFLERFEGYDRELEKRARTLHDELEREPGIKLWLRAMADLRKGLEGGAKGRRFVERGRKTLEKIVGDWDLPKALREEARARLGELGD